MKQSIILTVVILVLGVIPGLVLESRLHPLEEDKRRLTAEAEKLGLPVGGQDADGTIRYSKRQREDFRKGAIATASEVIAFARDAEALKAAGEESDDAHQRRGMEILMKLQGMNPGQLKAFIGELRSDAGLTAESRANIVALSIMMLSDEHPQAAVALFTESSDLVAASQLGGDHVISSALHRWADQNPHAALMWIQGNAGSFPDIVNDEAKCGVIAGTAANDPELAFRLIGELGFEHTEGALHAVLSSCEGNPQHRGLVLGALREHLAGVRDESERDGMQEAAFEFFALTAEDEDFDGLTSWVSESGFTEKEKEKFAAGLCYFSTKEDTGRWVGWLAENVGDEAMEEPVRDLVSEWTQQDYVAAGTWLSGFEDGPAKMAAVEVYAEAVAEYEPGIAGQWAMTLPPGPQRQATLRAVYQNWPESDPQGAAEFASDHGLD